MFCVCFLDDPCVPVNPCQNAGTCNPSFDNNGSTFTCTCALGQFWTGTLCTTREYKGRYYNFAPGAFWLLYLFFVLLLYFIE